MYSIIVHPVYTPEIRTSGLPTTYHSLAGEYLYHYYYHIIMMDEKSFLLYIYYNILSLDKCINNFTFKNKLKGNANLVSRDSQFEQWQLRLIIHTFV